MNEHPAPTRADIVRPFIITGGRTRSTWSNLNFETLIETLPRHPTTTLPPEQHELLAICTTPTSIAELSARLNLPVAVIAILAGDLLDAELVRTHHTNPADIELSALNRLIQRVRAL